MIEVGSRVRVLYEGRLDDGTMFDGSEAHGGSPLKFTVGAGTVIPGLERAVCSLEPHERATVRIAAADAYGEYDADLVQEVPAAGFPDAERLPLGGYIMLEVDGELRRVRVAAMRPDAIVLDFNHELAGRDLVFDLEVVEVAGRTGSLVEDEQHAAGCTCGCHRLKEQLLGE